VRTHFRCRAIRRAVYATAVGCEERGTRRILAWR
jgi:hypothetical protein